LPFDKKDDVYFARLRDALKDTPPDLRPYLEAFHSQTTHAGYLLLVLTPDFAVQVAAGAIHDRFATMEEFEQAVGILRHLEAGMAEDLTELGMEDGMEDGEDEEPPSYS
jgi:hypothetical protein